MITIIKHNLIIEKQIDVIKNIFTKDFKNYFKSGIKDMYSEEINESVIDNDKVYKINRKYKLKSRQLIFLNKFLIINENTLINTSNNKMHIFIENETKDFNININIDMKMNTYETSNIKSNIKIDINSIYLKPFEELISNTINDNISKMRDISIIENKIIGCNSNNIEN